MLIVDAHEDIAWNMLTYGRDLTRSVLETRRIEAGIERPKGLEDTLLGYPEYRRGRVAVVFASLFAAPLRGAVSGESLVYATPREAQHLYRSQIDHYQRLVDDHPDHFRLIFTRSELEAHLAEWRKLGEAEVALPARPGEAETGESIQSGREDPKSAGREKDGADPENQPPAGPPVGLVISMEGAEGIVEPAELEDWWERGVRLIGPAWRSTAFCGGTGEPGPLTPLGFELLERMADFNAGLDLTHMDEQAVLQALDAYPGPLYASHSNALALLRGLESNRFLSDRVIQGIVERNGVIGVVPFIAFLKAGWKMGDRREEGRLEQIVAQIDYICQVAGDARHVGIGTDFDGGFGWQSVPPGIDSIADLHKLVPLLAERGYTSEDIAAVLGENWLALLGRILP